MYVYACTYGMYTGVHLICTPVYMNVKPTCIIYYMQYCAIITILHIQYGSWKTNVFVGYPVISDNGISVKSNAISVSG